MDSIVLTERCHRCHQELPFLKARSGRGKQVTTRHLDDGESITERITVYETLSVGPFELQLWSCSRIISHTPTVTPSHSPQPSPSRRSFRRAPFASDGRTATDATDGPRPRAATGNSSMRSSYPPMSPASSSLGGPPSPPLTATVHNGKRTFRLSGFLPSQNLPVFHHSVNDKDRPDRSPKKKTRSQSASPTSSGPNSLSKLDPLRHTTHVVPRSATKSNMWVNDETSVLKDGYQSPFQTRPSGYPAPLSTTVPAITPPSYESSDYSPPYINANQYTSPLTSPLQRNPYNTRPYTNGNHSAYNSPYGSGYSSPRKDSSRDDQTLTYHINFYHNGELIQHPSLSPTLKHFLWAQTDTTDGPPTGDDWVEQAFTESEITEVVSDMLTEFGSDNDRASLLHVCTAASPSSTSFLRKSRVSSNATTPFSFSSNSTASPTATTKATGVSHPQVNRNFADNTSKQTVNGSQPREGRQKSYTVSSQQIKGSRNGHGSEWGSVHIDAPRDHYLYPHIIQPPASGNSASGDAHAYVYASTKQ